jgi:hypothetical protein
MFDALIWSLDQMLEPISPAIYSEDSDDSSRDVGTTRDRISDLSPALDSDIEDLPGPYFSEDFSEHDNEDDVSLWAPSLDHDIDDFSERGFSDYSSRDVGEAGDQDSYCDSALDSDVDGSHESCFEDTQGSDDDSF